MSSKNIAGVQRSGQRATVNKSRLNPPFNRVRIASDNESMKRWQTSKEQKFHHSVYVVLLDNVIAKHSSILRANPGPDPLKSCVYVAFSANLSNAMTAYSRRSSFVSSILL
jgi:hypothetical protein